MLFFCLVSSAYSFYYNVMLNQPRLHTSSAVFLFFQLVLCFSYICNAICRKQYKKKYLGILKMIMHNLSIYYNYLCDSIQFSNAFRCRKYVSYVSRKRTSVPFIFFVIFNRKFYVKNVNATNILYVEIRFI